MPLWGWKDREAGGRIAVVELVFVWKQTKADELTGRGRHFNLLIKFVRVKGTEAHSVIDPTNGEIKSETHEDAAGRAS